MGKSFKISRKVSTGALVALVGSAGVFTGLFSSPVDFDWKSELKSELCGGIGRPIVNVRQYVVNDVDSGIAGNYWAYDNYTREIKVWKTSDPNKFCATVSYKGEFKAIADQTSPGGTAILTGDEKGKMEGGYRATITGTFNPTLKTKGSIGKFDYQCDPSGNCPGRVDWVSKYFTDASTNLDWWGWIYRGGKKCGTWINAISGNVGDIVPSVCYEHGADKKNQCGHHKDGGSRHHLRP